MKINPRFLILPALVAGLQAASAADITGVITLSGTPPPEKTIDPLNNDATCGKLHTEPVKTQFYLVGAKGELKALVPEDAKEAVGHGYSCKAIQVGRRDIRCRYE